MQIQEIAEHNPWWTDPNTIEDDPKIKEYKSAQIKWKPRLIKYVQLDKDVVYSIRGPRQVGKTTMVKLMMREQLTKQRKNSRNLMYYACDLIKDGKSLYDLLESYYQWITKLNTDRIHIFLDEILAVKDWQTGIKLFVDRYGNQNKTIILTSSHSLDLKSSTERLPGRLGEKERISTHKILLPMKFAEYVELRDPKFYSHFVDHGLSDPQIRSKEFLQLAKGREPDTLRGLLPLIPTLDKYLEEYLVNGGIMTAVNEMIDSKYIHSNVFELYFRQIMGDISRVNREERVAKQILASIIKRTGTPMSWNSIRRENDIPSQPTVVQYASILQNMFILNTYYRIENDGKRNIGSDKKLQITNPFIFHALRSWSMNPSEDPYNAALAFLTNPEKKAKLVEVVVGGHIGRAMYNLNPRDSFDVSDSVFYYRTKKGVEIDFIGRYKRKNYGFEVKYQTQIKSEDKRGLNSLGGGCLITQRTTEQRDRIMALPASLFLAYI